MSNFKYLNMKRLLYKLSQTKACIITFVNRSFFIIDLWGTANWYQGIDKPTFWQWLYRWRTSLRTAIEVDKILHS